MDNADQQESPTEYSENRMEQCAQEVVHGSLNTVKAEMQVVMQRGRESFRLQRTQSQASNAPHQAQTVPIPTPNADIPTHRKPQNQPHSSHLLDKVSTVQDQTVGNSASAPTTNQQHVWTASQKHEALQRTRISRNSPAERVTNPASEAAATQSQTKSLTHREIHNSHYNHSVSSRTRQPIARSDKLRTASQSSTIKSTHRTVKTADRTSKTSYAASQTASHTQHAARGTKKASAKAAKGTKSVTKSAASVAKNVKEAISAIYAGGGIAVLVILVVVLIGAALSLFGSNQSSYTPVSAEVEAYTPLITKYAKQYGIPEYVELIKAVMMQESGGLGLDPMQSSEGAFNTRYPNVPNGIQDPEYSIQCGVQELKAALISADVETPIDMERIRLALQGYNFGNGYIDWAKRKYGGYSYANAVEFSTMQAERLGWESYGDTMYPAHVLRYYPFGRIFTGGSQAIVEIALSQLGNEGGQPYWSWYGFPNRVSWCACFVSWCADQCGYIESGIIPKFSGCIDGVNWFKTHGQWQGSRYEPHAGDFIFFDWRQDGSIDHVGIVEKCEGGMIYTIEGNSGDACRQRQYAVGSRAIYGFGTPAY